MTGISKIFMSTNRNTRSLLESKVFCGSSYSFVHKVKFHRISNKQEITVPPLNQPRYIRYVIENVRCSPRNGRSLRPFASAAAAAVEASVSTLSLPPRSQLSTTSTDELVLIMFTGLLIWELYTNSL